MRIAGSLLAIFVLSTAAEAADNRYRAALPRAQW